MPVCAKCGKYGLFLKVDNILGYCDKCLTEEKRRLNKEAEAYRQRQARLREKRESNRLNSTAKEYISLSNSTRSFKDFIVKYSVALHCYKKAAETEKAYPNIEYIGGRPSESYNKYRNEAEWHVRDAIERNYNEIIKNSKGIYRNNKKANIAACKELIDTTSLYKKAFDDETKELTNQLIQKLAIKFGLSECYERKYTKETENIDIDSLEGHDFEYWCANLLVQNGYKNVDVTKGSGDQGVDIIAERDEIRFAIQCKCYSSDVGNASVQEIVAGKALYKCHIGVVMTNRYFTSSAKELARANGILLWDRDKILGMKPASQNKKQNEFRDEKADYTLLQEIKKEIREETEKAEKNGIKEEYDPRLPEAVDIVIDMGQASISMLQRRMRIGYEKAGRLIDEMAYFGIVSEADGAKPRQVLVTREEAQTLFEDNT